MSSTTEESHVARTSKSVAAGLADKTASTPQEALTRIRALQEQIDASRADKDEPDAVTP